MLVIGDIHITSKQKEKILENIRSFVEKFPEEKNLIFLGDFVYHFSYERTSLLALYELFLEMMGKGKEVFVLAGNHDWIGNSFVFEEGKKAFDVMKKMFEKNEMGKVHFITEPTHIFLEGEDTLFLPYSLEFDLSKFPGIEHYETELIKELLDSKKRNEVLSGKINLVLNYFKALFPHMLVIFHHYVNGTIFPGQKSQFGYKDVAVNEQCLEWEGIRFISGHLHQGFCFKNYLCTGDVRASSPLEVNQIKGLWKINGRQTFFEPLNVNYYFEIKNEGANVQSLFGEVEEEGQAKTLQKTDLTKHYQHIWESMKKNFISPVWEVKFGELKELSLNEVSITMKVDKVDYGNIDCFLDAELVKGLKDIKLKKDAPEVDSLLEELQKPERNQLIGFGGWLELLKSFLQKQYPDTYDEYERILHELKVL